MNMKSRSLLKSGSAVAPPHPARPAALPGPSFGLCTASVANVGLGWAFPTVRSYRPLLADASVRCGVPSRWEGPVSCYLPKQVRDCGAWNMEMKWGSLLNSGSGVAPPHPARPAALPGLSFGLGTASAAAESVPLVGLTGPFSQPRPMGWTRKLPHDGTDPESRPSAFWRKVRDSGAGQWK